MKNISLMKMFNRSLLLVVASLFNILAFAQQTPPNPGGGTGGNGPGEIPETPVDMYEGILLLVAVSFIVAIYYYNKRRKLA